MPRINKLLKSFACQDREPALRAGRTAAMTSRLSVNHRTSPLPAEARPGSAVHAFHQRLPGYAPTPLRELPALAASCGVGRVLVKDESSRLGLPAFKILGASWATYRVLCDRLGGEPDVDDARRPGRRRGRATGPAAAGGGDRRQPRPGRGPHGAAAGPVAPPSWCPTGPPTPASTASPPRAPRSWSRRAPTTTPCTMSAEMAGERDLVVSDTSWPGYEDPPSGSSRATRRSSPRSTPRWRPGERWHRRRRRGGGVARRHRRRRLATVDLAVVPLGVGALGAAAGANLRAGREPGDGPLLVGVEPDTAACVAAAVEAGHVVEVPGSAPVDHGRAQLRPGVDARPAHRHRHVRRLRRDRRRDAAGAAIRACADAGWTSARPARPRSPA